jgi:hypothetical protein
VRNVVDGEGDGGRVSGAGGGVEGAERTGGEGLGGRVGQLGGGVHVGEDGPGRARLGVGGAGEGVAAGGRAEGRCVNTVHGGKRQAETYGEPALSICVVVGRGETKIGKQPEFPGARPRRCRAYLPRRAPPVHRLEVRRPHPLHRRKRRDTAESHVSPPFHIHSHQVLGG